MTNIKIFGWRANGDGIHVFGQWLVTDCFIRTQDDSMYLQSGSASACPTVFERITTWNDANGAAWMVIGYGATLRHSDAIYQRASWGFWDGGRVLTNREQGSAIGITIDDVQFSDRFPTMNAINLDLRTGSSSGKPHLNPATVADVTIRNFHVAAFSTQTQCTTAAAKDGCKCAPLFAQFIITRAITQTTRTIHDLRLMLFVQVSAMGLNAVCRTCWVRTAASHIAHRGLFHAACPTASLAGRTAAPTTSLRWHLRTVRSAGLMWGHC